MSTVSTIFNTHVYLGPSLDLNIAMTLLPAAHFHPPIQCGDIIRLLRLDPMKIIIIDGLYETVPAVWHKEILLAMELGVEVWGAASMGAMRAAELYHYGMNGFGQIYQDFKTGVLNDDDEVAVLHRGMEEQFSPINDAMVNIRATCDQAWSEGILSLEEKTKLIEHCKAQFYPYRSLHQAIKQLAHENSSRYKAFAAWLSVHGIIDVKKNDAIAVLEHNRDIRLGKTSRKKTVKTPMSICIKELLYYAHLTPFKQEASWLPTIEKQLQALHSEVPTQYMILAEIAFFTKKLFLCIPDDIAFINKNDLEKFIKQHQLYSPASDFKFYNNHPMLNRVYLLLCRSICQNRISNDMLEQFLPVIAHYYDLDFDSHYEKMFRCLLVIIFSTFIQKNTSNQDLLNLTVTSHFKKIAINRRYNKEKFNTWYHPAHVDVQLFRQFLTMYLTAVHGQPTQNNEAHFYFTWIYDAYALCYE